MRFRYSHCSILLLAFTLIAGSAAFAQTKKRNKPVLNEPSASAGTAAPSAEPTPIVKAAPKKNERPGSAESNLRAANPPQIRTDEKTFSPYTYEFSQPDFPVRRIIIRHGEDGSGMISFERRGFDEMFSDPLEVSPAAMERIRNALAELNFLDSTESYQYEKDYSHLGNMTFSLRKDGKERTVTYNYTSNKNAKDLADEYRRLSNQYIWIFDITVARENQPLNAPQLLDVLDGYLRRNEVSDPKQMMPLLKDLSNDERIPLIARNHAAKLAAQIEKAKK